jgi:hypothetical protein
MNPDTAIEKKVLKLLTGTVRHGTYLPIHMLLACVVDRHLLMLIQILVSILMPFRSGSGSCLKFYAC